MRVALTLAVMIAAASAARRTWHHAEENTAPSSPGPSRTNICGIGPLPKPVSRRRTERSQSKGPSALNRTGGRPRTISISCRYCRQKAADERLAAPREASVEPSDDTAVVFRPQGLALTAWGPQAPRTNERKCAGGWPSHFARGIVTGWPRPIEAWGASLPQSDLR
jgi:hypothetical protein